MSNKRKNLSKNIIISVVILIAVSIFSFLLVQVLKENNEPLSALEIIVGFVAVISGLSGVLLGLTSTRNANLETVRTFFDKADSLEYVHARKVIYAYRKHLKEGGYDCFHKNFSMEFETSLGEIVVYDKNDLMKYNSYISNFYQQWGILTKKRFLPLWVFEGASGIGVVLLYETLLPLIEENKKRNPYYADYFKWLYLKVSKSFKNEIKKYRECENKKA